MTTTRMHDDEVPVDEPLVRDLVRSQFPELAHMELSTVDPWGTDNAIWRLGEHFVVRFPRIAWASGQPAKEHRWLPLIGTYLQVAVPVPVGLGRPSDTYPFEWSVHRWIPGVGASLDSINDPTEIADDLALTFNDLAKVPTSGAPDAVNRARPLATYDEATRRAIERAAHLVDAKAATAIWDEGIVAAAYDGPPRWVHGDLEGNCLADLGTLCAIVDWGSACVGDPAVDVQVAWSPLFTDATRDRFLGSLDIDEATVARARAAAINQACGALPYYLETYPLIVERSVHKLEALGVAVRI